ncbi:MAG: hypothetical protein KA760_17405, partial [Steroidobacteraceae bacterium]|nr:hypothetical protein [Steroidobacteraceae bacterium]
MPLALALSAASVLYPRALLERLRACSRWRQQGGGTPAAQAHAELLAELQQMFPQSPLLRMYAGESVPWGAGLRPTPPPAGAPEWAVSQRE